MRVPASSAWGTVCTVIALAPAVLQGQMVRVGNTHHTTLETVPAGTPVRVIHNERGGTVAMDLLSGLGAAAYLVTLDSSSSPAFVALNTQPTGAFIADDMTLASEYARSGQLLGYETAVYLEPPNPEGEYSGATVEIELWDGDPMGLLDSAGGGYLNSPIPGTRTVFRDVPAATIALLQADLPQPVEFSNPDNRLWMVITSDACRLGWVLQSGGVAHGSAGPNSVFEMATDDDGATSGRGSCCTDGAFCDVDGPADDGVDPVTCASDPQAILGHCSDDDAETAALYRYEGLDHQGRNTFVASIYAPAEFAMALVPVSNVPFGSLDAGTVIDGTHIEMDAGGTDVIFDVVMTNWDTDGDGTLVKAYQANLDSSGYANGLGGTLRPSRIPCATNADCVAAFGGACQYSKAACTVDEDCPLSPIETCVGSPCAGQPNGWFCKPAFINTSRADHLMACTSPLPAIDTSTPDFRWASALQPGAAEVSTTCWEPYPDPGVYLGSLVLHIPDAARGSYQIGLFGTSSLVQSNSTPVPLLGVKPATITIRTGACCTIGTQPATCVANEVTRGQCENAKGEFHPSVTCGRVCPDCLDNETCGDGDTCTVDRCNGRTGECENIEVASPGIECCDPSTGADLDGTGIVAGRSDGSLCTVDTCSLGENRGVPVHTPTYDEATQCCNPADGFVCARPTGPPGDFDGSGAADLADFSELQRCYGSPATGDHCEGVDMTCDCTSDDADVAAFVNELTGPAAP